MYSKKCVKFTVVKFTDGSIAPRGTASTATDDDGHESFDPGALSLFDNESD